jgi:hypothetical protein
MICTPALQRHAVVNHIPCQSKTLLFALDLEVIVGGGRLTLCVDGEMKVLVYQEVVSGALPDNSEIIHKRLIKLAIIERALKVILGHASPVIPVAGILASAGKCPAAGNEPCH